MQTVQNQQNSMLQHTQTLEKKYERAWIVTNRVVMWKRRGMDGMARRLTLQSRFLGWKAEVLQTRSVHDHIRHNRLTHKISRLRDQETRLRLTARGIVSSLASIRQLLQQQKLDASGCISMVALALTTQVSQRESSQKIEWMEKEAQRQQQMLTTEQVARDMVEDAKRRVQQNRQQYKKRVDSLCGMVAVYQERALQSTAFQVKYI